MKENRKNIWKTIFSSMLRDEDDYVEYYPKFGFYWINMDIVSEEFAQFVPRENSAPFKETRIRIIIFEKEHVKDRGYLTYEQSYALPEGSLGDSTKRIRNLLILSLDRVIQKAYPKSIFKGINQFEAIDYIRYTVQVRLGEREGNE